MLEHIEVADKTSYLIQAKNTDTGLTSSSIGTIVQITTMHLVGLLQD